MRTARWLAVVVALACGASPARSYDRGVDLSSLPTVEAHGAVFRDSLGAADAVTLLRRAGCDAVRLRLWHSPSDSASALPAVLAMARRAHAAGMRLLLDLHYSDTWADPGHQPMPAAWRALAFPQLCDSVEHWTRDVVADLAAQGTPPALVQVGNEIDGGLLWDAGRVGGAFETPARWNQLATLLAAAARGVRAGAPRTPPRVLVHISAGGDSARCRAFFDKLVARGVRFDAIALSYYPLWHGGLAGLRANLTMLARRYDRDVYLVETAYPWTLRAFDDERNLWGEPRQLLPGLAATPAGQAAFVAEVRHALADTPGGHGAGLYWWEPAWIAVAGGRSPWENCALFDSSGAELPAARALGTR